MQQSWMMNKMLSYDDNEQDISFENIHHLLIACPKSLDNNHKIEITHKIIYYNLFKKVIVPKVVSEVLINRELLDLVQDRLVSVQEEQISESIHDKPSANVSQSNLQKLEDYKFSMKNNSLGLPNLAENARTSMRTLKLNMEKRKNFGIIFSLYTFNNLAMNKALRIKRKLKLIDEPPIQINDIKKGSFIQISWINQNWQQKKYSNLRCFGFLTQKTQFWNINLSVRTYIQQYSSK